MRSCIGSERKEKERRVAGGVPVAVFQLLSRIVFRHTRQVKYVSKIRRKERIMAVNFHFKSWLLCPGKGNFKQSTLRVARLFLSSPLSSLLLRHSLTGFLSQRSQLRTALTKGKRKKEKEGESFGQHPSQGLSSWFSLSFSRFQ